MTSLLAFDINHNFQFKGFCKIIINSLSSMLLIESKNEDFKPIYATFKWKFVMRKNFLFIFADCEFMDFCLVFKDEKICQKVYRCVSCHEETIQESDKEDMITNRFLIPIFQKINSNSFDHAELIIQLISKWINLFDGETKERYSKLMEEYQVLGQISAAIPPETLQHLSNRKRKIDELLKRSHKIILPKLSNYTNHFYYPQIQLGYIGQKGGARPKLLIFTSSELTTFHLFTYISHRKVYACQTCKWKKTAITDVDENGNICAKLTSTEHSCFPQISIPENFIPSKIIKKPDYELFEFSRSGKTLIIFDSNDRSLCYEYRYNELKSIFYCRGCSSAKMNGRKVVWGKLFNPNTEKEYVEIISNDHVCEIRKYQPEKYNYVHQYLIKPNFEIQKFARNGVEKKTLIVFNEKDRSLCYSYYYYGTHKYFICYPCSKAGKNVQAKLCQNSEGEEYIILSTTQHICKLKPYIPLKTEVILHPPQIELLKETKNGLPKLFVFVENDRSKCYIFTTFRHTIMTRKYFCAGCRVKIDSRKSERNEFKEMVSGYLDLENDGNYCFKLPAQYKHICLLTSYQPEEFQISSKCYEFFFFQQKNNSRAIPQLAIYHPHNKSLAFHFRFNKNFICKNCEKMKNYTLINMQMDESGKAYFNDVFKKHTCKPQKVSSLLGPKITKLKDAQINYQTYMKTAAQEKKKKNEKNAIRFPNFKLQPNKFGEPEKRLILFDQRNKELCYEYYYCSNNRTYNCCRKKCYATAKLDLDENGEKYIILGKHGHRCDAIKYQLPCKILKSPNFIILNKADETKLTKVIHFTSAEKDFCYEYSYCKSYQKFGCLGCNNMGRKVCAKIIISENGEECLELANSEHVCQPRKYEPEKFVANVIPESMFKLCKNTKDEENKKLLLFISDEKDMAFIYYATKENFFCCFKCRRLGKTVSTKLCKNEENGEKYLEHNMNQHVCDPEKVNIDELDTVIIKESMFEFCHSLITGEKNRRILVFTSEKKEFVYIYHWCQKNSYRCTKCKKLDKLVVAKFIENENGESHLELNGAKHVCVPEKFKRENFIQRNLKKIEKSMFKFTENAKGEKDKRLIIFTTEDKKIGYTFTWTKNNAFRCTKCFEQKINNLAKIQFDENGKPSIFHDLDAHVCQPRICENKIIPESMFKIAKNNDLIVFLSEEKKKAYEYYFCGRNYYKCRACFKEKKKTVSANLEENENGEKYLKLNHAQHICKPKTL